MKNLKIVGHRGARALAPENTIAALKKAIEYGVDEIEVDIRVTNDAVAVLHHNQFLTDQAGNHFNIRSTKYAELRRHKTDLITLEEAIQFIDQRVPLQMEVKWGEQTQPVITVINNFLEKGWQPAMFLFGSKKQQTLVELHQALPIVPIVIIEPFLSIRGVIRARQVGSRRLSMNRLGLWSGFIRSMHRRGYQIYAYTLNNPRKAKLWQRNGLAGVITDSPNLYKPGSLK